MKIVVYCQHVLGIGHYIRTLALCRALSRHDLILVTGGEPVDVILPAHVRNIRLPSLMMDERFKNLHGHDAQKSLLSIKEKRSRMLMDIFKTEAPDLFLVELYPFGRKAFRFEIDPVLEAINVGRLPSCKVLCSVRDILVEKQKAVSHENRAKEILNRFFDGVLIHADPKVITLDQTFGPFNEIKIPTVYTGYVAQSPPAKDVATIRRQIGIEPDQKLVVASAGGGKVGTPLFTGLAAASARFAGSREIVFVVFSGPFAESKTIAALQKSASPNFRVEPFKSNFTEYLKAADLSISMAGYNTCMDILSSKVPALVLPFEQNREQRLRAERLARLGALKILNHKDLGPQTLAKLIESGLKGRTGPVAAIDLNGAQQTALWIEQCLGGRQLIS